MIPAVCKPSAMGSAQRRSTPCCGSGYGCCRTPMRSGDRKAGYRYQISILQAEFSLTQVLDRPVTGRVFFEEVIRENLDIGRPSQVQSQGGSRASDRNYHQQYARLRDRQATQEPAGSAADRLSSQPASARGPEDFSRLLDWRGCLRSGRAACRGRWPKSFGLTVR